MPRSLFDDMTQREILPMTPQPRGAFRITETSPVLSAERNVIEPNAGKKLKKKPLKKFFQRTASTIGDIMSTPKITPNANLQLAQIAAAIAPEGSWQSRLAQIVGGQVQNEINTQYLQDVLAGREPTTKEIRGVPLDVQMSARQQALGEQQQKFEQGRRVEEFDIGTTLQKINQFIDMMNARTQQKRAETDQFRALLSEKEFNAIYGEGKRRQFADFGGVGLYNFETGEYEIDPTLVALREKIAAGSGGKDDRWDAILDAQTKARQFARDLMEQKGTFVIDSVTGAVKVVGDNQKAIIDYQNAYKQAFTKYFEGKDWQPDISKEDIESFVRLDLQQILNPDKYMGIEPTPEPTEDDENQNPFTK